jgi:hypothetical protein
MSPHWTTRSVLGVVWPLGACAVCLLAFWYVGWTFFDGYVLDLGSMTAAAPRHTAFLFYWTLLGSAASAFLLLGLARSLALGRRDATPTRPPRHRAWMACGATLAFLLPWAIRTYLLRGAQVTDDESAYRFMAEVLATGRLWVDSYPMKVFFDRVFMVNDGKFYAQYFIGWPALMAPGAFLHVTGYMNAVYAALTVPALYGIARRMGGALAARASLVLFLASPMLMVGAATELAHPSCVFAIAWSAWFYFASRERPAAWWTHAGVAFFFSLAFLVRPASALGAGLPILIAWLLGLRQVPAASRFRALLAFAVPAVFMAAVFFGVNQAQNGSPLVSSYARMQAYMREVNYENVGWSPENPPGSVQDFILPNRNVGKALATTAVALVRLVFDLFGSPLIAIVACLAWTARRARLAWWSAFSFVAVHFFMGESGVDTFGPVHFYEMSPWLVLLAGVGVAQLSPGASWGGSMTVGRVVRPADRGPEGPRHAHWPSAAPAAVVASLVLVSLAGFVPVRLGTLKRVADNANMPADAVRTARLSHAVVFTAGLFTPQNCIAPTRHFSYFRPNNDPGLTNDILWVNHLGWEVDHELMRYFPGRTGYLIQWDGCRAKLIRL